MTQQSNSQYFLRLEVGSALGGGICTWGWDLCRGWIWVLFFSFYHGSFFPHPVFVLENNGIMSHFLKS